MHGSFATAEELLLAGRHHECADYCRKELEKFPRSVTLRLCMSRALLRGQRHLAAMHEVERCLQIDPSSAEARLLLESIEQSLDHVVDESGPTVVRGLQVRSNGAVTPRKTVLPPPRALPPAPKPALPGPAKTLSRSVTTPARPPAPRAGQIDTVDRGPTRAAGQITAAPPAAAVAAARPYPHVVVSRPRTPSRISAAIEAARLNRSVRAALFIMLGLVAAVPLSRLRSSTRPAVSQSSMLPLPEPEPADPNVTAFLNDLWIHPLAGPNRRMPIRDSRLFGAEREGDRPGECRGGHCGVDIGGERYGEPVLAVHDGLVEHVERGPNRLRGGRFVRIAHREGTVYTQYFHLASIPPQLATGVLVKAGDVIGFVGASGVKRSGPHLHFTVAVRTGPTGEERYIDPEPLIALWPVRTADDASGAPTISAGVAPGLARGHLRQSRRHHHHHHDAD
jgi:murein DD-endopeptidase MepM/ murein hydrolase activator NlpD